MSAPETIIRASSLNESPDCGRRGAAKSFRREIEAAGFELRTLPHGIGAEVGSGLHKGAATILTQKAIDGALPPVDFVNDILVEYLRDKAKDGMAYDKVTLTLNDAERQVIRMTQTYRALVVPKIQPVLIEHRLEAEVPGTSQHIVLSGQSDVVAKEPSKIRDLKGGARLGTYANQVGAYSALARSHLIDVSDGAIIDWVPRTSMRNPPKPPMTQIYDVFAAETAMLAIISQIDKSLRTFREGDEERKMLPGEPWSFSANPSSMLCSEKWCPCYGVRGPHTFCREWEPKESKS